MRKVWAGNRFFTMHAGRGRIRPSEYNCSQVTVDKELKVVRSALPFIAIEMAVLILLIVFPEVATWLPKLVN